MFIQYLQEDSIPAEPRETMEEGMRQEKIKVTEDEPTTTTNTGLLHGRAQWAPRRLERFEEDTNEPSHLLQAGAA